MKKSKSTLVSMLKTSAIVFAALSVLTLPALAQRPTSLTGYAYTPAFVGWFFAYSPFSTVYVSDNCSHTYVCNTDLRGEWWLSNIPSNRCYTVYAISKSFPYYRSAPITVWIPERPWWWINMVFLPDLKCCL